MAFKNDLKQLLKPYYWVNIILSISYVFSKRTPMICNILFPNTDCELDTRETEILFFLIIVVMLRTRKAGSVTMVNYLSASFVYTKIANLILWLYADVRFGLAFGVLFVLCALVLPEPTYSGPEQVIYFRGLQTLEDELRHRKSDVWLICLYAAWHPACVNFANVFAELSSKYHLDNFKFGKMDVGRYPEAAQKFRVQDGPTSRQLPTLILFREGEEKMRRPEADHKGKLMKFLFSADNVKAAFDLETVYDECKQKSSEAKSLKKKD